MPIAKKRWKLWFCQTRGDMLDTLESLLQVGTHFPIRVEVWLPWYIVKTPLDDSYQKRD